MACPYFYPLERRPRGSNPRSAMLPLGDVWTGLCRAPSASPDPPDDATLRLVCALGYARARCPRFPMQDSTADAVRFVIRSDDGITLRLQYVLERDHHPLTHGPLEYSLSAGRFVPHPDGEILNRQAEAYVQSYLSRKKEAALP